MRKIVRLTESELVRIVKRVIKENENQQYLEKIKMFIDEQHYETALEFGKSLGLEGEVSNLIIDSITDRDYRYLMKRLYFIMGNFESLDLQKNPQVRQEIDDFIRFNPEFNVISDKQMIYDRIYQKVSHSISEIIKDVYYDISSINCGNNSEGRSGTVDIDDYGVIIIRYCEGNDKDLEYLKEKGKKLLQTKYKM